jgi:hypothetical protein
MKGARLGLQSLTPPAGGWDRLQRRLDDTATGTIGQRNGLLWASAAIGAVIAWYAPAPAPVPAERIHANLAASFHPDTAEVTTRSEGIIRYRVEWTLDPPAGR